tara:strand:+ start:237 stop:758 length:522 start_codon:yes stop_codon:yes gene_type:complete
MEFETYADVIDSYEISNDKLRGVSLTDYIKNNNIKIKEIEMDPLGDLKDTLGSRPMEKEGIMQVASRNMDINIQEVVKEFIRKRGRRPKSLEEIKEFFMNEMGTARRPDVRRVSYEPGKYSDEEIEMYENYKYNMNEQMPGMPIMEIDEFLRMEYGQGRLGVASGGLPSILGV